MTAESLTLAASSEKAPAASMTCEGNGRGHLGTDLPPLRLALHNVHYAKYNVEPSTPPGRCWPCFGACYAVLAARSHHAWI